MRRQPPRLLMRQCIGEGTTIDIGNDELFIRGFLNKHQGNVICTTSKIEYNQTSITIQHDQVTLVSQSLRDGNEWICTNVSVEQTSSSSSVPSLYAPSSSRTPATFSSSPVVSSASSDRAEVENEVAFGAFIPYLEERLGFILRPPQVLVIKQALCFKKNIVLGASTNWGKSIILKAVAVAIEHNDFNLVRGTHRVLVIVPTTILVTSMASDLHKLGLEFVAPGSGDHRKVTLEDIVNDNVVDIKKGRYNGAVIVVVTSAALFSFLGMNSPSPGDVKRKSKILALQRYFGAEGSVIAFDEYHTKWLLPYESIKFGTALVHRYLSKASIIAMTATTVVGDGGIAELLRQLDLEDRRTFVHMESSFRGDVQIYIYNASIHLKCVPTEVVLLQKMVVPEVRKVVEWVTVAGGNCTIVYVKTEALAQLFKTTFCDRYGVNPNLIGVLLGGGKMSRREQELMYDQASDGKLCVLVATTVIAVGATIPGCLAIVMMGTTFGGFTFYQLCGRVHRTGPGVGRTNTGLVYLITWNDAITSDFVNTPSEPGAYYDAHMTSKRLMEVRHHVY